MDAARSIDLTGRWTGFYEDLHALRTGVDAKDDQRFPISADIRQEGTTLDGEMTDESPITHIPYRLLFERTASTLKPHERARMEAFLAKYPNVIFRTSLPKNSKLSGSIEGSVVRFIKRYQGPQRTSWFLEAVEFGQSIIQDGEVTYEGSVGTRGESIEGRWKVYRKSMFGLKREVVGEGAFCLFRHRLE